MHGRVALAPIGRYGGEEDVAVEVCGQRRPYRPGDLEEIAPPQPSLWRSLVGGESRC